MTAPEAGKVDPTLLGSLVSILHLIESHLKGLNQALMCSNFPHSAAMKKKWRGEPEPAWLGGCCRPQGTMPVTWTKVVAVESKEAECAQDTF